MAASFPSHQEFFQLCIEQFNTLPRTGKPNEKEWTVLSCVIQHSGKCGKTKVVSLGTGTKCIGSDQMCPKGFTLNDSHAEIMARRGFLRYLYSHMIDPASSDCLIYNQSIRKFQLCDGITFHFFSTHAPCGDATIFSSHKNTNNSDEPCEKRQKLSSEDNDNFTGAKLLTAIKDMDPMAQDEGAIRTKPGRGIRTLSMSCSDKLSRWNVLGIQGALIDLLLDKPIYLKSFTFCGQISEKSLRRAIYQRWSNKVFECNRYQAQRPEIYICPPDLRFQYAQANDKDPSPASIVWCNVREKPLEVAISGKRQGVTKTKRDTLSGALRISKYYLFRDFVSVIKRQSSLLTDVNVREEDLPRMTCKDVKALSKEYQMGWRNLKQVYFLNWTEKLENLLEFKLDIER